MKKKFQELNLKEILHLQQLIALIQKEKIIDIVVEGIYFTKLIFIISDKTPEIAKFIEKDIKRGITGIYGKGMYTNKEKLVLMCAIGRNDLAAIKQEIKKIDSKAFLIITNSREVLGTGFKEKIDNKNLLQQNKHVKI